MVSPGDLRAAPPRYYVESLALLGADAASIGFIHLAAALWILRRSDVRPRRPWPLLAYAIPCAGVWTMYLLAFWPGLMSSDSQDQWGQVLRAEFHNYHPAFHTLTLWLITRLWLTPAAVALTQIVALSLVFAATARELEAWGVCGRVRLLVTLAFSCSLVNGTMVVTLWKDVPYAITCLGLFAILLALVRTRGRWAESPAHLAVLAVALVCVTLFRHNGALVGVGLVAIVLWLWPAHRGALAATALVAVAACLIIVGPVYRAIGVKPIPAAVRLQYQLQQIAALVHDGVLLSTEDEAVLAHVLPLESWRSRYNCYIADPIVHSPHLDRAYLNAHADEVRALWRRLVRGHGQILLRHQLCASSLVWRLSQPVHGWLTVPPLSIHDPASSLWPRFADQVRRLVDGSLRPSVIWWVWRPALYLYLTLFCALVAAARVGDWRLLVAPGPAVLNSLVWMMFVAAQDVRYQYPVYVIGLVMPALLFARRPFADSVESR